MTSNAKEQELEAFLGMARGLLASMDSVVSSMSEGNNVWHFASYKHYATQYTNLVQAISEVETLPEGLLFPYDVEKIPSSVDTIDIQQKGLFQQVHGDLSMLCAWLDSKVGKRNSSSEIRGLEDFLSSSLRPAMLNGNPEKEREVQDTIEKLLIGQRMQKGVNYDRETGRVKHSGKESIPDFVFRPLSTALEVKLVKDTASVARIVDEINADIAAYSKEYGHLIFLVYDIGSISDVAEFKRDIEASGSVKVLVVKN